MARPEPTMTLRVNGRETELPASTTFDALLQRLELDRRFLVVELNGEPMSVDQALAATLRDGDRIELVRPVAGG